METSPKRKHRPTTWKHITLFVVFAGLAIIVSSQLSPNETPAPLISAQLETTLGRGWMTSADWSPDGQTIAIGSSTGVWLYDADDLSTPRHHIASDSAPVSSLAFALGRPYLVEGRWDTRAYVWDLDDLSEPMTVLRGHIGLVNDVAFVERPDTQWVATASSDKTIRLWDAETSDLIRTFEGHEHSVTSIDISLDGQTLISGSRDHLAILWDIQTGEQLHKLADNGDEITDVMIFSLGDIGIASQNRMSCIYVRESLELLNCQQSQHETQKYFELDDHWIINNNRVVATHEARLNYLSYNSRLNKLAIYKYPEIINLSEVDASSHMPPINTLEISPDDRLVAVGTGNIFMPDNQVLVWDIDTDELIASLAPIDASLSHVITLAYQPDTTVLAIGDTDGQLLLWDYEAQTLLTSWHAHEGELLSMSFTDANTLVTGGDDAMLRVWDVTTGDLITEFESPNGAVHHIVLDDNVSFTQDTLDNSLTSFALSDEEQSLNLLCSHGDTLGAVTLNADASLRATATFNHTILLTDVASGEVIGTLEGHGNLIEDLMFSADGRWLASASWDRTVRVWDMTTGEAILILEGHTRPVNSVRFSADSQRLLSAGDDGTVRVWRLES